MTMYHGQIETAEYNVQNQIMFIKVSESSASTFVIEMISFMIQVTRVLFSKLSCCYC